MSNFSNCPHDKGVAHIEFKAIYEDDNPNTIASHMVQLSIKCGACGQVFHFPHLPPGDGITKPAVSQDALTILLPVRPGRVPVVRLTGKPVVSTKQNPIKN